MCKTILLVICSGCELIMEGRLRGLLRDLKESNRTTHFVDKEGQLKRM